MTSQNPSAYRVSGHAASPRVRTLYYNLYPYNALHLQNNHTGKPLCIRYIIVHLGFSTVAATIMVKTNGPIIAKMYRPPVLYGCQGWIQGVSHQERLSAASPSPPSASSREYR